MVTKAADIWQTSDFCALSVRRHPQTCRPLQISLFPRPQTPQTPWHVSSRHFGLVRRHPQTCRGTVLKTPPTSADSTNPPLRDVLNSQTILSAQSVDCVWLPIEARHRAGTTEILWPDQACARSAKLRYLTICCSDINPAANILASTAHGHTMSSSLPGRKPEASKTQRVSGAPQHLTELRPSAHT